MQPSFLSDHKSGSGRIWKEQTFFFLIQIPDTKLAYQLGSTYLC